MQNSKYLTRQEAANIIGVSAQTITNWYEAGKLPGNMENKRLYLAKEAVMKLNSTLKEYNIDTKWVESLKAEQDKVIEEYKSAIQDYKKAIGLLDPSNNVGFKINFLLTILYLGEDDYQLRSREIDILRDLFYGDTLEEISERSGLTRERVRQIMEKGLRRVREYNSYEKIHQENQVLKKELDDLKALMKFDELSEKDIEKRLSAAEVLSKKIIDFGVSVRCLTCLKSVDIVTISDLINFGKSNLLGLRNFGKKTYLEIYDLLDKIEQDYGLDLTIFYNK